jgi:acyl carrier protein
MSQLGLYLCGIGIVNATAHVRSIMDGPRSNAAYYAPHFAAKGMSVRATVSSVFEQVAQEQQRTLAPLSDNLKLLESGLDSLSFAIIVARLEDALDFDPFNAADAVEFPVTFGDFVRLYEKHPK